MSSEAVVQPEQAQKNRLVIFCLVLAFVVPFVLGHLAYFHGWYAGGKTTNKGELIAPPIAFTSLGLKQVDGQLLDRKFLDRKWSLLYVLPADCQQACRNSLFQMRQVRKAAGRDSERIRLLVIQTQAPDAATEALLQKEFAEVARVSGEAAVIDHAFVAVDVSASRAGRVYAMDPMGMIMLRYAPQVDEKTSIIKAQDILTDLQKMLKDSQIG